MSTTGSRPVLDVNGKLLGTGAALLCIGGAVLMTGAALASVALAQAAKKWIDQLEESPCGDGPAAPSPPESGRRGRHQGLAGRDRLTSAPDAVRVAEARAEQHPICASDRNR